MADVGKVFMDMQDLLIGVGKSGRRFPGEATANGTYY
jgi:hypothetical protein